MIYIPDDSEEHESIVTMLTKTTPILESVLDDTEDTYDYFSCFVYPV